MFLKKISKVIVLTLVVSALSGSILNQSFADSNNKLEPSDPVSTIVPRQFQSSLTIGEIEGIFQEYLNENNIILEFGSPEYLEYLYAQMLDKEDEKLLNHPDYYLILAYFAEYISSFQNYESSNSKSVFTMENLENRNKTTSEIRVENIEKDKETDLNLNSTYTSRLTGYNATNAKNYALKWWNSYNSSYNEYPADCTNFVSQCLYAGGASESRPSTVPSGTYETQSYWYSDKPKVSTPWIRVTDFHSYWAPRVSDANYAGDTTVSNNGEVGDVVQFRYAGTLTRWHTMIITKKSGGVVYLTGHTTNREDYAISNYDDSAYDWSLLDF